MRTFFFGASDRKLFGAYHPPSSSPAPGARSQGVVLCYPGVQEYNVCHSAFRKLAVLLSRAGLHVLRFDYYGTGDSAGELGAGSPAEWAEDVRTAVDELREVAKIRNAGIVGFRLGATIAALAVSKGLHVSDLVLWDPIVSGKDYVDELEYRDRQENLLLLHPTSRGATRSGELLGYPFSGDLRAELTRIDLRSTRVASAASVSLLVTEERPSYFNLRAALETEGQISYQFVSEDAKTTNRGAREEILLATKSLAKIREIVMGPPS